MRTEHSSQGTCTACSSDQHMEQPGPGQLTHPGAHCPPWLATTPKNFRTLLEWDKWWECSTLEQGIGAEPQLCGQQSPTVLCQKVRQCRGAVLATCMPQDTPQDLSLFPMLFPSCDPGVTLHTCHQYESPESFQVFFQACLAEPGTDPSHCLGVTTSRPGTINIPALREIQVLCKPWTSETAALRQHTEART